MNESFFMEKWYAMHADGMWMHEFFCHFLMEKMQCHVMHAFYEMSCACSGWYG